MAESEYKISKIIVLCLFVCLTLLCTGFFNLIFFLKYGYKMLTGKTQLSVILCLACRDDSQLDAVPNDVLELINADQLSTFITKVGHPFILIRHNLI